MTSLLWWSEELSWKQSNFYVFMFQVNFEDRAPLADEEYFDEIAPMQGKYKTSDSVSYEDLMEFALDA